MSRTKHQRTSGGNTQEVLPPIPQPAMEHSAITAATPHLPVGMVFDDWVSAGRTLAENKRDTDWKIGDWIVYGRDNFADQIQGALPGILDDERQIKRIEKTVKAFPRHLRDKSLSFDHHAHVASMPIQEALPLLKQASEEHLSAGKLRLLAMVAKVDSGQTLPREEDSEYDSLMSCIRAWNRAPVGVREDFAEMVSDSSFELIEP